MQHLPDIPLYLSYKSVPRFCDKVSDAPFSLVLTNMKSRFQVCQAIFFGRLNKLRKLYIVDVLSMPTVIFANDILYIEIERRKF